MIKIYARITSVPFQLHFKFCKRKGGNKRNIKDPKSVDHLILLLQVLSHSVLITFPYHCNFKVIYALQIGSSSGFTSLWFHM